MSDRTRARVIRVRVDKHDAVLAEAAAMGDPVLLVKDAGDIAADDQLGGGTLLVDDDAGTKLAYTTVEYAEDVDQSDLTSPDTIILAEPLTVALDAGTQLWAWEEPDDPTSDDGVIADYIAICVPEDDEDAAELGGPIEAEIPPGDLRDDLPVGEQPGRGVPVVLEYDDDTDEWTVLRPRGGVRGMRYNRHHLTAGAAPDAGTAGDAVTADEIAAGALTRQLPHRRIARSQAFRALVNGVEYGPGAWTLDPVDGVVALTLGGWETTDNADIWFEYWHRGLAVVAPDPDPVTPMLVIPGVISAYEDHGAYHGSDGYVGQTFQEALGTSYDTFYDRFWFDWTLAPDVASFASQGLTRVRIDAEFDGSGQIGFVWNLDNPGYPGAAQWPDGTDSGSHITLDSYWGDGTEGCINVSGPTTWTYEFALDGTASDPYYEGFNYDGVLGKLEVSLHALASGVDGYNHVYGQLQRTDGVGDVQIKKFDLVVFG